MINKGISEILWFKGSIFISKTFILWNRSSLKFPISISFFKSLLDEQINLTSTLTSLIPLTLLNFWSVKTLSILDCMSNGISETWSIKSVPLLANKGTLLIDQVSEIPLDIQSKILRVLTDQKFKRVNGINDVSVDVRLICSSSKDLKKEIEIGNFREDLFHRINVFEINIEPLNQRISDIPLLIKYFSKKISENYKIRELDIDENNSYILLFEFFSSFF